MIALSKNTVSTGNHSRNEAYHRSKHNVERKPGRESKERRKEWGKKHGFPEIVTVEQRWDHDETFRNSQIELKLTRNNMIEYTQISYDRLPEKPLPPAWIKEEVQGRYKLTSSKKGGDSRPLREIPGIKEELKRNPGNPRFLARERKGEDEHNITPKHPARGNSAASSSYESSYHHSTAGSSTDTRHTLKRNPKKTQTP